MEDKLSRARVSLITAYPFFASFLLGLQYIPREGLGTFATDGMKVYYDPKFLEKTSMSDIRFILMHEVMHCVLCHMARRLGRDPVLHNLAADIIVNEVLKSETRLPVPKGAALAESFGLKSVLQKTAEDVYEELKKKTIDMSSITFLDKHLLATSKKEIKEIEEKAREWSLSSQLQGNVPAWAKTMLEALFKPEVDWRRVLASYLHKLIMGGRSWIKPNRRAHVYSPFIYPAIEKKPFNVTVSLDTSGSISEKELKEFLGETFGILKMCDLQEVRVLQCDADVTQDSVYKTVPKKIKITGRGGTDFRPVFKKVTQASCLVYFTDGYGTFPDKAPSYPVVWVGTREFKPPFGAFVLKNKTRRVENGC